MFPKYKYYLMADDSTYYKVENGSVVLNSIEKELQHSPIGWADTEIMFQRDTVYWGIFTEISKGTQYVLDGAMILRYIKATQGFEGVCILLVKMFDESSMSYQTFYKGDIDFSNDSDEENYVEANIASTGLQQLLTSRQDTNYEIDLLAPEAISIKFDGVKLASNVLFVPGQGDNSAGGLPNNDLVGATSIEVLNISFSGQQDAATSFISSRSQTYAQYSGGSPSSYASGGWLFRANTTISEVNISGTIQAIVDALDAAVGSTYTYEIRVLIKHAATNTFTTEILYQNTSLPQNTFTTLSIPINHTLTNDLLVNDCVYIYASWVNASPGEKKSVYPIDQSTIYVTYNAKVPTTNTKALRYFDAANSLVKQISNGNSILKSSLLSVSQSDPTSRFNNFDTDPHSLCLTSGNALTQSATPYIQTNFTDMFKELFGNLNAAAFIDSDDNLNIERLVDVFQDVKIATIDECNNITKKTYTGKIFNDIKVGYQSVDTTSLIGQDETNGTYEYLADKVTRFKNPVDFTSQYIGAVSQIESRRASAVILDSSNQPTTTTDDNATYIIEVDPTPISGNYKPYLPIGTISGINDPSNTYNILISGARRLFREFRYIRSLINFGNLNFQTSTNNKKLVSSFVAGNIIESASYDLTVDTFLGHDISPIFQPEQFEFDCVPSLNLLSAVKANPNGYIEFNYYGNMLKGYVLTLTLVPAKGNCHLVLLSHADNDLTLTIR